LHAQSWLRHEAARRGPGKVAVIVESNDVFQLYYGYHDIDFIDVLLDIINLTNVVIIANFVL